MSGGAMGSAMGSAMGEGAPEFSEDAIPDGFRADLAVVLGSGLGSFVERIGVVAELGFGEVAGLPVSTVPGHAGRFVLGRIGGRPILVAQGRVHLYEGHPARDVAAGVRFLARCGVRRIVLTNAAGSANPDFEPGTWMQIADHLNLSGQSPFSGGPDFHDMSAVYSAAWRAEIAAVAGARGMTLHEGVYACVPGPQYETPAEVRMLRRLGADAVGMSTVHEAMQARALGIEVAGFSCLTNWGAGMGTLGGAALDQAPALEHAEVLEAGRAAAGELVGLLEAVLAG
ncbi:purine-nucleoside phosphorylase [soil metagenome]